MRRAETITNTVIALLKDEPESVSGVNWQVKAKVITEMFETSGGYWLTKEEKQLIYSIVKCW